LGALVNFGAVLGDEFGGRLQCRGLGLFDPSPSVPSPSVRTVPAMTVTATIRILCETNPSLETAAVNGPLAWATVLGGGTALGAGASAALVALDTTPAHLRADLINRGLGIGFSLGMLAGLLMFFVFIAKIAS
jgi:hypothetical protein